MEDNKIFYVKIEHSSSDQYFKCKLVSESNISFHFMILIEIRVWNDGETEIKYNCTEFKSFNKNTTFITQNEFNTVLISCLNDLIEVSNTNDKVTTERKQEILPEKDNNKWISSSDLDLDDLVNEGDLENYVVSLPNAPSEDSPSEDDHVPYNPISLLDVISIGRNSRGRSKTTYTGLAGLVTTMEQLTTNTINKIKNE